MIGVRVGSFYRREKFPAAEKNFNGDFGGLGVAIVSVHA